MRDPKHKSAQINRIIQSVLNGEFSETQFRQLYKFGSEAVYLAMMAAVKQIARQRTRIDQLQLKIASTEPHLHLSTPSGQMPIYIKPNKHKRRSKRGAKEGHRGSRRAVAEHIDRRQEHHCKRCPDCGGPLQKCNRKRTRIIKDIPEGVQPVVTEHTVYRDYCPRCKKHVEPVVTDALPKATIGHRLVCFTAWLHYGLGVTIAQIISIVGYHLHTSLTAGGLIAMWQRLAQILTSWYEQIAEEAKGSAHLHADETGWRVSGLGHWLWCFANDTLCYYTIDRCRGSLALQKFFTEAFDGVLITDFWSAYNLVCAEERQCCLVHLLRELEKTDQLNDSEQ